MNMHSHERWAARMHGLQVQCSGAPGADAPQNSGALIATGSSDGSGLVDTVSLGGSLRRWVRSLTSKQ